MLEAYIYACAQVQTFFFFPLRRRRKRLSGCFSIPCVLTLLYELSMRDRTSYTSGSVPWDVENKFGESKMQDTEILSVILATAHAYLNAGV